MVLKGPDVVFSAGYGLADLDTKEQITPTTLFNTGSISKTFVANGILILAEEGLLKLDDPIVNYFDFEHPEVVKEITIKHLLSHTSGLPDLRNVRDEREFYLTAKDQENFEPIKGVEQLNFQPGERFQYSNPAYNGLALIIEKVTGMKWQDFIMNRIFKKAGMPNSKITDGPYPEIGVAHGYIQSNGHYIEYDYGEVPTFAAAGNGGVWSSVVELARYEQAIRANKFLGKQLTEESRSIFMPPNWKEAESPFVGYSWFLGEEALFDQKEFQVNMVFHNGSQGGFRAFFVSIPEKSILFTGLFNSPPKDMRGIIKEGLKIMMRNDWLD